MSPHSPSLLKMLLILTGQYSEQEYVIRERNESTLAQFVEDVVNTYWTIQ